MTDTQIEERSETRERNSVPTIVSIVVGVVILVLLALAFASPAPKRPQPGDPAPDFTITLFDGEKFVLGDARGQVVVLNFWASWCQPCRREAPELQSTWEAYQGQDVVLLGITYQDAQDASQRFIDTFGITYANGVDEKNQISRLYGITGIPETFIIDQEGNVAWSRLGEVQADELAAQLDRLLQ